MCYKVDVDRSATFCAIGCFRLWVATEVLVFSGIPARKWLHESDTMADKYNRCLVILSEF